MTSDDSHGPGIGPGTSPATGPIGAAPPVPPAQTGPIGVGPADPATGGILGSPPTGPLDAVPGTGALLGTPPSGPVTAIGPRLTPESVRRAAFGRTGIGRRGYSETDVERFRNRVVQEIGQANAEKAELRREHQRLRAEVQRLRDYYRRQKVDVDKSRGAAEQPTGPVFEDPPSGELVLPVGPSADSVNVMSRAQQAADQHIAQAEDYARRLVSGARRQYEEILLAAQNQADQAAAEARDLYDRAARPAGGPAMAAEVDELHERVSYLRTFAQVTQVQLRSVLDGLRQELDKLNLPAPDTPPVGREIPRTPPTESGRVLGHVSAAQLGGGSPVGRTPDPGRPPGGAPAHAAPAAPPGTYGGTSPATGPMRSVPTPPRGFPARGTLPVRTP